MFGKPFRGVRIQFEDSRSRQPPSREVDEKSGYVTDDNGMIRLDDVGFSTLYPKAAVSDSDQGFLICSSQSIDQVGCAVNRTSASTAYKMKLRRLSYSKGLRSKCQRLPGVIENTASLTHIAQGIVIDKALSIGVIGISITGSPVFGLGIRSDDGGRPGQILKEFTEPKLIGVDTSWGPYSSHHPGSADYEAFLSDSSHKLKPGKYWVTARFLKPLNSPRMWGVGWNPTSEK